MTPEEEKKTIKDIKRNYFLTTMLVYFSFFIFVYFIIYIFLMILQVHPYINLLFSILLLLMDILFTDRIMNHYFKDRWIQK